MYTYSHSHCVLSPKLIFHILPIREKLERVSGEKVTFRHDGQPHFRTRVTDLARELLPKEAIVETHNFMTNEKPTARPENTGDTFGNFFYFSIFD